MTPSGTANFFRRLFFGSPKDVSDKPSNPSKAPGGAGGDGPKKDGLVYRVSRKVVPGLPRMQTFKRQQSEKRVNLSPVRPSTAERRAVSVERRAVLPRTTSGVLTDGPLRASAPELQVTAPDFLEVPELEPHSTPSLVSRPSLDAEPEPLEIAESYYDDGVRSEDPWSNDANFLDDVHSITSSLIQEELETRWILNLSMHFRDKSNREKFFVTYREADTLWRRVTISLDHRNAPENSLEMELVNTRFQRDKSSKIYESIRDSLSAISFYDTVTNLKLQTTDGRLHVHVAEDLNVCTTQPLPAPGPLFSYGIDLGQRLIWIGQQEIITYPLVREVQHLRCHMVRERDIAFDSHMSGFVYKVQVGGRVLIKKEIPGPDTINEFVYEINALHSLQYSDNVIDFFGVVMDDEGEHVKGLLISYAERGTLVDIIYDHQPGNEKGLPPLPWSARATWARQIVEGLSDVHESGFVQGDFTLSNIVIDGAGNAKIIDINRRGCPVGWEPPEARPLIKSSQGISMYIGVKSDLYQLGMVLWALAMGEDEPEKYGPGLVLGADADVPSWYRRVVDICLSEDPRMRIQASSLLSLFPDGLDSDGITRHLEPPTHRYDDPLPRSHSFERCRENGHATTRSVSLSDRYSYNDLTTPLDARFPAYESPYLYPTRGRSPPSPLTSHSGHNDMYGPHHGSSWTFSGIKASYSDVDDDARASVATGMFPPDEELVAEAHESMGRQSPRGTGHGAGLKGGRDDHEAPSHPVALDEASEGPGSRKGEEAAVPQDGTLIDPAASSKDAALREESMLGATTVPAENVGDLEEVGWGFTGGLGIMAETGNTGPINDPTAGGDKDVPTEVPVGLAMSGDRVDPSDPTEPTAGPNTDSSRSATEGSTEYSGKAHAQAQGRDDIVEEGPRSSLPNGYEMARIDSYEKPRSGRTSDGAISVLTGVGGADEDARGDLAHFPASLDDEPELMSVPTKMATMSSAQRGPEERASRPISVGY